MDIKKIWYEIFPNSKIYKSKWDNELYFKCILAKDKNELSNGIIQNDPLSYSFSIENEKYIENDRPCIFIKPNNIYLTYSRVKLRKKSINNITEDKLKKRFFEVKKMIIDNKDNFINLSFNINDKI